MQVLLGHEAPEPLPHVLSSASLIFPHEQRVPQDPLKCVCDRLDYDGKDVRESAFTISRHKVNKSQ